VLAADEKIHFSCAATWHGSDKKAVGEGKVFITNKAVAWFPANVRKKIMEESVEHKNGMSLSEMELVRDDDRE